MSDDYVALEDDDESPKAERHDPAVDRAKDALRQMFFGPGKDKVYYQRQLQVLLEKDFFHWVTARALAELSDAGEINTAKEPVGYGSVRFFWRRPHRFWKREMRALGAMVQAYSQPAFAEGLGRHAETMFDAALPRAGLRFKAENVREYAGLKWEKTGHDLDRVYELDGVSYGVEIKNKLQYIDEDEFEAKLAMCFDLKLKPLFIMRALPRTYAHRIIQQGGYAMIYRFHLYPHGQAGFAREVRELTGLPVDAPRAIYQGTLDRFSAIHLKTRDLEPNQIRVGGAVVTLGQPS